MISTANNSKNSRLHVWSGILRNNIFLQSHISRLFFSAQLVRLLIGKGNNWKNVQYFGTFENITTLEMVRLRFFWGQTQLAWIFAVSFTFLTCFKTLKFDLFQDLPSLTCFKTQDWLVSRLSFALLSRTCLLFSLSPGTFRYLNHKLKTFVMNVSVAQLVKGHYHKQKWRRHGFKPRCLHHNAREMQVSCWTTQMAPLILLRALSSRVLKIVSFQELSKWSCFKIFQFWLVLRSHKFGLL